MSTNPSVIATVPNTVSKTTTVPVPYNCFYFCPLYITVDYCTSPGTVINNNQNDPNWMNHDYIHNSFHNLEKSVQISSFS